VPDGRTLAELVRPELIGRGYQVFEISAATHEGLRELSFAMASLVAQARANVVHELAQRIVITPRAVNEQSFTVTREPEGFRVRGERPERWVRQTDFSNDEAVGYLGDRLARLGVEDALLANGAVPGVAVMIGPDESAVIFDWHPSIMANSRSEASPRGTDVRVDLGLMRSNEDDDVRDD